MITQGGHLDKTRFAVRVTELLVNQVVLYDEASLLEHHIVAENMPCLFVMSRVEEGPHLSTSSIAQLV